MQHATSGSNSSNNNCKRCSDSDRDSVKRHRHLHPELDKPQLAEICAQIQRHESRPSPSRSRSRSFTPSCSCSCSSNLVASTYECALPRRTQSLAALADLAALAALLLALGCDAQANLVPLVAAAHAACSLCPRYAKQGGRCSAALPLCSYMCFT